MHITDRIKLCLAGMLCAFSLSGSEKSCIPGWVTLQHIQEDLTIQGEAVSFRLERGALSVYSADELRFQPPGDWIVADVFAADIDRDDEYEVLLHVWKPGSFGEFEPFWREKEDKTVYSEHLFLYEWDTERADRLDPKWMSSAMPVEGRRVFVSDDGAVHVVSSDAETVWIWEGWGLKLLRTEGEA